MDRSPVPERMWIDAQDRAWTWKQHLPDDGRIPYHREDTCAEKWARLRERVNAMMPAALNATMVQSYGAGWADAREEVLALLDAPASQEKENG